MFDLSKPILTMTSRQVAELVEKRHDNVMQVCRSLRESGVCPEIQDTPYINQQNGQTYTEFVLNKRDSHVLVARLSPEFTGRLVDRWLQLEAQAAKPAELSRMDLIRIAMDAESERLELAKQVQYQQEALALQAPKVEALERISESDGSTCITRAAKDLKVRPKDLFSFLVHNRFIYRRAGSSGYCAYQDKIQSGLMEHKVTTIERSDGSSKMVEQVLVTPKGLTHLAHRMGAH